MILQIGYQEGAYDGRQAVFQKGFDVGYESGFRNGYRLGTQIGQLNASNDISNRVNRGIAVSSATSDLILKRPTRGQCVVCTDQNLINENIDRVVELQEKHFTKIDDTLASRYSSALDQ